MKNLILLFVALIASLSGFAEQATPPRANLPGPDGNSYAEKNGLKLESLWALDRNHNLSLFQQTSLSNNYCRTAIMKDGIVYVAQTANSDITARLYRFDALTGQKLSDLVITINGNEVDTPFFGMNIGKDDYGHVWLIRGLNTGNNGAIPFYRLNLNTGAATLIKNLEFDRESQWRCQYFDVKGDITGSYIVASIGTYQETNGSSLIYYWDETGHMDYDYLELENNNQLNFSSTIHMLPDPSSNDWKPAIIDTFTDKPFNYDIIYFDEDEEDQEYLTDMFPSSISNRISTNVTGNYVFDVDGHHLMAYALKDVVEGNYMGAIAEIPDYMMSRGVQLWDIPTDGLGPISDGGNRIHCFDSEEVMINGRKTTLLMYFKCSNGIAMYTIKNNYINFESAQTEAVCLAAFDSNNDGKLSYDEAAAVTNISTAFRYNTQIDLFDEFQYFTGITSLPQYAFGSCSNLTKITLPPTVTTIDDHAFDSCYKLESVGVPPSVTSVGNYAFYYCFKLADFDFTNIKRIGWYAFCRTGLTHVVLPATVEYIGTRSFYWTTSGCTVHLNHTSIDVYNANNTSTEPTRGMVLPIVGNNDVLEIDRHYFHSAYNATPTNFNKALTPYVRFDSPFKFISCEVPLLLNHPDVEAYIITGYNPDIPSFTTKRYQFTELPANTGMLLKRKTVFNDEIAFPQTTYSGNNFDFTQNILTAAPEGYSIAPVNNEYVWILLPGFYEGDETNAQDWFLDLVAKESWSDGDCEAYLLLHPSYFEPDLVGVLSARYVKFDDAILGDANGNGNVDVNDVTAVINYILGKNPSPFIYDNANINGDNNVDVLDVTLIINKILGINQ